jgi:general L-amino acid transport system permease protein
MSTLTAAMALEGGRPPPPAPPRTLFNVVRESCFNGPLNALATLVMLALAALLLRAGWRYLVTDGTWMPADIRVCVDGGGFCWAFVQDRWRQILFGTFPYDQHWRPALACLLFLLLLAGTAWATLRDAAPSARVLMAAWVAGLVAIAALMWGGVAGLSRVEARLWSGLPLTFMLAGLGTGAAFIAGVALALARREGPPFIAWLATIYIEFFRGVPLISLLFVASIMAPLFLPEGVEIDKLARAQAAFAMFFAAYMAEAVRGGLQAVPEGQAQAATALGLGFWRVQLLVVLPQALRIVIPSLVNIFIAAFKDTSLVVVISMMDLLGTANIARADAQWWGIYIEPYIFIGLIYLVLCAAMAAYSRALERRLGQGAR